MSFGPIEYFDVPGFSRVVSYLKAADVCNLSKPFRFRLKGLQPEQLSKQLGNHSRLVVREVEACNHEVRLGFHAPPKVANVNGDKYRRASFAEQGSYVVVVDERAWSEFSDADDLALVPSSNSFSQVRCQELFIKDNHLTCG
jgi:hypothetical protein